LEDSNVTGVNAAVVFWVDAHPPKKDEAAMSKTKYGDGEVKKRLICNHNDSLRGFMVDVSLFYGKAAA
jgi:hypothetical protein